ncbi:DNA-directed DNA polymerase [Tanacetum coccineum]
MGIDKALADLGASISLMPYSMYTRLDFGELKPTRMCIELANKLTQYPKEIAKNVIVKIDKFIFPVDFVVLDMKEDHKIPIILKRPFLATAHAMIDEILPSSPLDSFLFEPIMNYQQKININLWEENDDDLDDLNKSGSSSDHKNWEPNDSIRPTLFAASISEADTQFPKLKEISSHLEYAFLDNNKKFPVIISSLLNPQEKESLLKVLTKHKAALAWNVTDIKGISPSFCTHKILMEDNFKPVVQPQRILNPKG